MSQNANHFSSLFTISYNVAAALIHINRYRDSPSVDATSFVPHIFICSEYISDIVEEEWVCLSVTGLKLTGEKRQAAIFKKVKISDFGQRFKFTSRKDTVSQRRVEI